MRSPLQKAPNGLLELFNLKTLGRQPNEFEELVQPSIDVFEFYAMGTAFTASSVMSAASGFPVSGSFLADRVRRWRAVSAGITLGANVGTFLRIRLGIRTPSPSSPVLIVAENRWIAPFLVAGQFYDATFAFPVPAILPPGTQFVARADSDASGTDHALTGYSLSDDLTIER